MRSSIDRRIRDQRPHIDRFISTNQKKYLFWMTDSDLESLLLTAMWRTLKYRDANPGDGAEFYLRF